MRLFNAEDAFHLDTWQLMQEFHVSGHVSGSVPSGPTSRIAAALALAFRPFSPGVPEMLVVGGGAGASVWLMEGPHAWRCVALLPQAEAGAEDAAPSAGAPIGSVAWAPAVGHAAERVAYASDSRAWVAELRDACTMPSVVVVMAMPSAHANGQGGEEGAHSGAPQVGFNALGTTLAVAHGERVRLFRPDLTGEWREMAHVMPSRP